MKKLIDRSVELVENIQSLEKERVKLGINLFQVNDLASRGANLIHSVTGSKSVYAENLRGALKQKATTQAYLAVAGVIQAFHIDLSKGHLTNIRQEVEAIVVSEIMTQATLLSRAKGVHPAAPIIVACAAVEEFLRNWCELKGITVIEKQRSISKFAQELRAANQIDLPIERRIMSWADYRNDAAHGANWDKLSQEIANRLIREINEFIIQNSELLG